MAQIEIDRIREPRQSRPFLNETTEIYDKVRQRAYQFFERRGGAPGNELGDWLQAEKELVQIPDVELAERDGQYQADVALPGMDENEIRIAALPDALIVVGKTVHHFA